MSAQITRVGSMTSEATPTLPPAHHKARIRSTAGTSHHVQETQSISSPFQWPPRPPPPPPMARSAVLLPLFLYHLFLVIPLSSPQSPPPQNLQTTFPAGSIPAFNSTPPPSSPSPSPSSLPTPSTGNNATPTCSSKRSSIIVAAAIAALVSYASCGIFYLLMTRSKKQIPPNSALQSDNHHHRPFKSGGNINGTVVDENGLDMIYLQHLDSGRKLVCRNCKAEIHYNDLEEVEITSEQGKKKMKKGHRKEKIDEETLLPSGYPSSSDFEEETSSASQPKPSTSKLSHARPPRPPPSLLPATPTFVPPPQQHPPPWAVHSPSSSHSPPPRPPSPASPPFLPPSPSQPQPQLVVPQSTQSPTPVFPPPTTPTIASTPPSPTANNLPLPPGRIASPPPPPPPGKPGAPPPPPPPPGAPPPPPPPGKPGAPPPPPPPGKPGAPPPPPPPGKPGAPPPPPPPGKPGAPPPPPPPGKPGAPPPPPGKGGPPPPRAPGLAGKGPASGLKKGQLQPPSKLRPLHWDKLTTANVGHSVVWDKLHEGSFRVNEDDLEAYFGNTGGNRKTAGGAAGAAAPAAAVQIVLLDKRRSQNIAIILRSLAASRSAIVDALCDGGDGLSLDSLEKLSNIALTKEEEVLLRNYNDDPAKLADAESFLFHILRHVPNLPFSRVDALLLRATYGNELAHAHHAFVTLEAACLELKHDPERRSSTAGRSIFVKLLEAVLKAGNKMNQGTARGNATAFNLGSLRKLSDVKSADGKTTLLHFLVEQVVRSEGRRASLNLDVGATPKSDKEQDREFLLLGLPVVAGLSSELASVKKAAQIDYDTLVGSLSALDTRVRNTRGFVAVCGDDGGNFAKEMRVFLNSAEEEVKKTVEEKEQVMELVKKTTEFYQPGASKDKNAPPLQLFVIVKDFLGMVEQACLGITKNLQQQQQQEQLKKRQEEAAKLAEGGGSSSLRANRGHDRSPSDSGRMPEEEAELRSESGRISMPRFPNLPPEYLRRISCSVPGDWDVEDD